MAGARVRIEPWGPEDLDLLERLMGDPETTRHLGGPEPRASIVERQARYERHGSHGEGRMFRIVDEETGAGVGSVGYWERPWRGETVYETGWSVLPAFQGRGVATAATALALAAAASEGRRRLVHAFPGVDNAASNAICRKLGFTLLGPCEREYPRGRLMLCNDWRLVLKRA